MNLMNLFLPNRASVSEHTSPPPRAVVALGGGGARGLAHLGVMQSIGESGVQTERIVGVSMGSLIGAMCAADPDIFRVQAKAIELLHSPIFHKKQQMLFGAAPPTDSETSGGLFSWYGRIRKYLKAHRQLTRAVTSSSLIAADPLRECIECLLPDIDIQETPIPLSIVAVDLVSGQRVVLEKGPLRKAVLASSAIPGIFPAVPWEDMLLSDIGVIESVPTLVAEAYDSDLTIAVDVGQDHNKIESCDTALEVMMRVDDICEQLMRRQILDVADVVVRPRVGSVAWFDFSEPERLIGEGRDAGHRAFDAYQERRAA